MEAPRGNGIVDPIILTGAVGLVLTDALGNIKHKEDINNLVVTSGKEWFAQKLAEEAVNEMTHVAIGDGTANPAAANTDLAGNEIVRVAATSKTRTGAAVEYIADFGAGVGTSANINEAGIFDGSSGTLMLARVKFSGTVNKAADDSLQITWTITVS